MLFYFLFSTALCLFFRMNQIKQIKEIALYTYRSLIQIEKWDRLSDYIKINLFQIEKRDKKNIVKG